tara:strand:+ start:944 stop:1303 length:360 start_codon:yes stop_codon:yes gene_type:complete
MLRHFSVILCFLMPALGMSQQARESGAAELRWLDRTTGALQNIIVAQEAPIKLGALEIHLHSCRIPLGDVNPDAFALVQIKDWPRDETLFEGWMMASSPALNALEHPRYDVWVLRCKTL